MRPTTAISFLAYASASAAHATAPRFSDGPDGPARRAPGEDAAGQARRDDLSSAPVRRDAPSGAACGPSGGNAVCAAGLCCSDAGVCGTGGGFCTAPACQLSYGPACDGNKSPTGQDTSSVPRPLFGSVPYGVDISHCTVNGKVALTFDDGPYIYTTDLLDLLQKNNVTATFFIVGTNGGKGQIQDPSTGYPAIIQRMHASGHQIGSHSWSHQDLSTLTAQQRRDQIVKNEIAIANILGFIPTYFRPPYTRWNADALSDLKSFGYHVQNYDIDTRDWQGDYNYAQNTFSSILMQHSPSSSSWISLAHDIEDKTVHGFVQYMIDQAKKLGYQLVTVGECLGDPQANWYRDATSGQPYSAGKQAVAQQASKTETTSSVSTGVGSKSGGAHLHASTAGFSTLAQTTSDQSTAVTPTPVANPNFGAGTGENTGIVNSTVPQATKLAIPSTNSAVRHAGIGSVFGLALGLIALASLH